MLCAIACGGPAPKPAVTQSVPIHDFRDRVVPVEPPVTRVVCLIESALSGIYMLGAGDRIVGIPADVYDGEVFPAYAALDGRVKRREIPAPGNWDFVNLEKVLSLEPDLVVIWSHQTEAIAGLERHGIPVYGVMLRCIQDVYREIGDFGRLFGVPDRAGRLIAHTRAGLDALRQKVGDRPRPRVYFMWGQGLLHTAGAGSTADGLITASGGVNVCSSPREHLVVNLEKLLEWDPEVIVMWRNRELDPGDILSDSRLQTLTAVKRGAVHEMPSVFFNDLWTLKFLFAARQTAGWFHPDAFTPPDIASERRRMCLTLYGSAGERLCE